ncbi:hypothetical protein [Algoriphagus namhaensis]
MKKYLLLFALPILLFACNKDKDRNGYKNSITYELFQSSDFQYTGSLEVLELNDGRVQLDIRLNGNQAPGVTFPAHLHFGAYDQTMAEIATILTPVTGDDLRSSTILTKLTDGSEPSFDDFLAFDGHIKIHLADAGPDYDVILVSGNVGKNHEDDRGFDMSRISVCSSN